MCDERERLIVYVYDECDAGERASVAAHVESCATCQEEIAGLRRVREDLLAWDVPDHGSVWRPFAPPAVIPWWRQTSGWGLAAAASVMFAIGAAGGVTVHRFLPERVEARPLVASAAPQAAVVTPADLSSAEQRILDLMRERLGEVDARVRRVSLSGQSERLPAPSPELTAKVNDLEQVSARQYHDLLATLNMINSEISRSKQQNESRINMLMAQISDLQRQIGQPTIR